MFLDVLPTSTITVVLILGGMNDSTRFEQLHNAINGVLKNDGDNDGETESSHYRQLSNNIICNNVCFNQLQHAKDLEEITGAASLDLIVDKRTPLVVLILGGMNDSTRFEQLHNSTNGVIKNDADNDSKIELSYNRQSYCLYARMGHCKPKLIQK
ncbi:unnamed protein product [Adineta steineri]|uniref:Uncharacterized protein n=1 Tax=Adineta steineri TaxID=433720 RepID=A0A814UEN4_9BILA|nr:unnamed protein product [Adineta steineri]